MQRCAGAPGQALPKHGQMVQAHGRQKLTPEAPPGNASSPRVAIVLYPFTLQVKQDVANALLHHFVRYHAYLGFRVLQYTQARSSPGPPAPCQLRTSLQPGSLWQFCGATLEPHCSPGRHTPLLA